MNNPRRVLRLTPETLQWARRAILERLAGKDDKVYLFQLLSDVSEDLRDRDMMIRALAETLPIAGERRTTQLRELMELARRRDQEQGGRAAVRTSPGRDGRNHPAPGLSRPRFHLPGKRRHPQRRQDLRQYR